MRAAAHARPANTLFTAPPYTTGCGVSRIAVVPSPSCPALLAPHAHIAPVAAPLLTTASANPSPAAIARTPEIPGTWTGVSRVVVVPSPSCPLVLTPQAQSVPSAFSAYES